MINNKKDKCGNVKVDFEDIKINKWYFDENLNILRIISKDDKNICVCVANKNTKKYTKHIYDNETFNNLFTLFK